MCAPFSNARPPLETEGTALVKCSIFGGGGGGGLSHKYSLKEMMKKE